MNSNPPDNESPSQEDIEMERLFSPVAERAKTSPELLERAKANARPAWQAAVTRQQAASKPWYRATGALAMAAALGLVAVLGGLQLVSRHTFDVQIVAADRLTKNQMQLGVGASQLAPEDEFYTEGLTRLRIAGAVASATVDVRLAPGTRVRWLNSQRLFLEEGGVYVDTQGSATFGIDSPLGQVNDIGTRYVATLNPDSLEVAVSEGAIAVNAANERTVARPANAGTAAIVTVTRTTSDTTVSLENEPADHPRWLWATGTDHEYQGALIADALSDVTQRLGKNLEYASSGDRAQAHSYVVQGETRGLTASDALRVISATSGLKFTETGRTVRVEFDNP